MRQRRRLKRQIEKVERCESIKQSAHSQFFGQEPKNPILFVQIYNETHLQNYITQYLCPCDLQQLSVVFKGIKPLRY